MNLCEALPEYADMDETRKNCGRKFALPVAHSTSQPSIDLGDVELLNHKYDDKPEDEDDIKKFKSVAVAIETYKLLKILADKMIGRQVWKLHI